jgi:hypothetical protein
VLWEGVDILDRVNAPVLRKSANRTSESVMNVSE